MLVNAYNMSVLFVYLLGLLCCITVLASTLCALLHVCLFVCLSVLKFDSSKRVLPTHKIIAVSTLQSYGYQHFILYAEIKIY